MTSFFFFFKDTPPTEISPLPLPRALPIYDATDVPGPAGDQDLHGAAPSTAPRSERAVSSGNASTMNAPAPVSLPDRKSTRLNSSHANISYAVFCLKKKTHLTSHILISHVS